MKRILVSLVLTILCLLVSCGDSDTTNTTTQSQQSSTGTENTAAPSVDLNDDEHLQSTNRVFVSYASDDTVYYPELEQFHIKNTFTPQGALGNWQFKMVSSCEEFNEFFYAPNISSEIFEDNYIVYLEGPKTLYDEFLGTTCNFMYNVGFHSFEKINGEYSIIFDRISYENEGLDSSINLISYAILVPKDEIEYIDGIQRVRVYSENVVKEEIHIPYPYAEEKFPSAPNLLLIEKGKDDEEDNEYGLDLFADWNDEYGKVAVLHFEWNEGRLGIVGQEIKNGDLYITANSYQGFPPVERPLYQLCDVDVTELSENYNVYVTVNRMTIPSIPIINYEYDEEDALDKALYYFVEHYGEELPEGFVYQAKLGEGQSLEHFYVYIFKMQEVNDELQNAEAKYAKCVINKTTLMFEGLSWHDK